jgi:23S rRNA (adenine2503-C2)-methyltransferase
VLFAKRYLDEGERLRNLVFMGMGEPLHHYDETARAIRLLTHPEGLGMSPRKITVSTVGLVPGIRRLGEDFGGKLGLAVSLHAPDNETRNRIMPMNRHYPVEELLAELHRYPLPKRRRLTIEYTLIRGINDSARHAERLAGALRGLRCKVNLIPMNPVPGSGFETPSEKTVEEFHRVLSLRRVSCSVRKRRGDDVDAACGQLAFKGELVQLTRRPEKSEPSAT